LKGAAIRVAEDPTVGTTVKADGTYDLVVSDHAKVTPFIDLVGYHTIYLQTFKTDGQDLERVNFQVPSDAVYNALRDLLKVPVDANNNPVSCAIVSTFSTRNVRDVPFGAFTGYGAHGVAGATATATPAIPGTTYFNKNVIPDASQPLSSIDGGVIWPVVPTGVYTIRAQHPDTSFASFTATCKPGRIVNANPPWGLHELGQANPAKVSATFAKGRVKTLRATALPPKATLTVTCSGAGCPFTTRKLAPTTAKAVDLRRAVGTRAANRLTTNQKLAVQVTAHGYDGTLVRLTPKRQTLCVPLGETKARPACPR
jgi:hypothetical protein